ncbi:putative RNA-directed DNA polymerase [Tanacetum coccineum]
MNFLYQHRTEHRTYCFYSQTQPDLALVKDPEHLKFPPTKKQVTICFNGLMMKEVFPISGCSENTIIFLLPPAPEKAHRFTFYNWSHSKRSCSLLKPLASSRPLPDTEAGIDFEESFAPVARLEAIRLFIAHAANPDHPSHMYRLKKALYGLKQAPRAWYDKLSAFLIKSGFTKGVVRYPTLFTEKQQHLLLAKPTEMHLTAIKRIFRYLKGTIHMGLWYPKDSGFELKAFADADYAGCHDTRRSTSGSAQFLGHRLVSWSSKKQKSTAISTTEAEYIALSGCCAQILWMRSQLRDYGFAFNKIPMYCDNQSAIALCCNSVQHSLSSTLISVTLIKEQVERKVVDYISWNKYQWQTFYKALTQRALRNTLPPMELDKNVTRDSEGTTG